MLSQKFNMRMNLFRFVALCSFVYFSFSLYYFYFLILATACYLLYDISNAPFNSTPIIHHSSNCIFFFLFYFISNTHTFVATETSLSPNRTMGEKRALSKIVLEKRKKKKRTHNTTIKSGPTDFVN